MELIKINDTFFGTWQRQGNDKNGNAIYIVNIFEIYSDDNVQNITYILASKAGRQLDKYGNIKLKCYKQDILPFMQRLVREN